MLSFNNSFSFYINNYRIIDSNLYVACPFEVIVCILSTNYIYKCNYILPTTYITRSNVIFNF